MTQFLQNLDLLPSSLEGARVRLTREPNQAHAGMGRGIRLGFQAPKGFEPGGGGCAPEKLKGQRPADSPFPGPGRGVAARAGAAGLHFWRANRVSDWTPGRKRPARASRTPAEPPSPAAHQRSSYFSPR